jgi:hypothetical protein
MKQRGRWLRDMRAGPQVPIQSDHLTRIPEPVARLAYEQYAYEYGTDQSFERLHERGGFGTGEALALLADLIERERGGSGR